MLDFVKDASDEKNKTLDLTISSFQMRQHLARNIYSKLGFNKVKVIFSRSDSTFSVLVQSVGDITQRVENMEIDQSNELTKMKQTEIQSLINYELGFSLVIEALIKYQKPIIGHNMFLDMLFMYHQFVGDLPATLDEFIFKWTGLFPSVYDTKCMATTCGLFTLTNLNSMSQQFLSNKKFKSYLEFEYDLASGFNNYVGKSALHEAGYDSYLTGVCFGGMVKYLEAQNLLEF